MANKPQGYTHAHSSGELVLKSDPLILFRGALDHAEAEVILTQAQLADRLALEEGEAAAYTEQLIARLQELLDLLRAIMTAEYKGTPLEADTLFGYTLDELQERSHNAQDYYGVPTMTRPSYEYGETYARLNLIRTELRRVEEAAVALFLNEKLVIRNRPDILTVLNRLSSAAHVLMCEELAAQKDE